jgi:predicted RNA-binding protein YlqC (UPF0109 family)
VTDLGTEVDGNVADDAYDDDDYDDDGNDVNSADPVAEDDNAGNRVTGGTPLAVLGYLVKSIASEPDAIAIQTEETSGSVKFHLHVAPDDMGRVIGRRGRVIEAVRTLVAAAGARDGVRTVVDVVDR